MRDVGFVETTAYVDWAFKKAKEDNQIKDVVFVGRKAAGSV